MGLQQDEAQVLVEQGKQQLQWSLWSIALQSFERAIATDDHCLAAWEGMAEALRKLGKWNEVVEVDEKIAGLRMLEVTLDANFYISKGATLCDDLGQYEAAIECFNQALKLEPTSYRAWHNRGVAYGKSGRKEEAIASYDEAIEFKPDGHEAWCNRGNLLHDLGRYKEAIESYDKVIEFKPDCYNTWTSRGNTLHRLGRYEEAIDSFNKAIEFKPDYHEAWFSHGSSLGELGRYEEAIESSD